MWAASSEHTVTPARGWNVALATIFRSDITSSCDELATIAPRKETEIGPDNSFVAGVRRGCSYPPFRVNHPRYFGLCVLAAVQFQLLGRGL
jgi:hypothetical protein